jgi:hypothetical protein
MKTKGKRQLIQLVADELSTVYGGTLHEYGTDVVMARRVIGILRPYLKIAKEDIDFSTFQKWAKKRDPHRTPEV